MTKNYEGNYSPQESNGTIYDDKTQAMNSLGDTVELPNTETEQEPIYYESTDTKRRNILIGIIAAIVVIAAIAAGAYYLSTKVGMLSAQVNAEGWNKDTSTPIELAIYQGDVKEALSDDDESNDPESYKELTIDANCKWDLTDITERGDYTLEVKATPILEDGTMFKLPEVQVVKLEGNDVTATFDLEKLDLATASSEELEAVAQAAQDAATDTGDTNKVAAVAAATQKTAEKATSAGNSNASAVSSSASKPSSGSSNSGSSASKPSSGGSSSSSGSTGGSSSVQPSEPSKPAHTHSWQPVYKTIHHDAVTETVIICNACGAIDPGRDHMKSHAMAGENASTHTETRVIQAAYDEKVLTGYKCSCGATK